MFKKTPTKYKTRYRPSKRHLQKHQIDTIFTPILLQCLFEFCQLFDYPIITKADSSLVFRSNDNDSPSGCRLAFKGETRRATPAPRGGRRLWRGPPQ